MTRSVGVYPTAAPPTSAFKNKLFVFHPYASTVKREEDVAKVLLSSSNLSIWIPVRQVKPADEALSRYCETFHVLDNRIGPQVF